MEQAAPPPGPGKRWTSSIALSPPRRIHEGRAHLCGGALLGDRSAHALGIVGRDDQREPLRPPERERGADPRGEQPVAAEAARPEEAVAPEEAARPEEPQAHAHTRPGTALD